MKSILKKSLYHFVIEIVILSSFLLFPPPWLNAQEKFSETDTPWQLKTEKEGIQLYRRWMPATAQFKTRQLRGLLSVEASPEEVLRLIRFESNIEPWVDKGKMTYAFNKNQEGNQWFSYTRFGLPWPIGDQDIVLKNSLTISETEHFIHIRMHSAEGVMDSPKGVKRITQFEGSWRLRSQLNGKTQVDYRVQTKGKPSIPTWISDPVIQQSLLRTLRNLRASAEKNHLVMIKE